MSRHLFLLLGLTAAFFSSGIVYTAEGGGMPDDSNNQLALSQNDGQSSSAYFPIIVNNEPFFIKCDSCHYISIDLGEGAVNSPSFKGFFLKDKYCVLCHQELKKDWTTTLFCKHVFHTKCLMEKFDGIHWHTCPFPLCKKQFATKDHTMSVGYMVYTFNKMREAFSKPLYTSVVLALVVKFVAISRLGKFFSANKYRESILPYLVSSSALLGILPLFNAASRIDEKLKNIINSHFDADGLNRAIELIKKSILAASCADSITTVLMEKLINKYPHKKDLTAYVGSIFHLLLWLLAQKKIRTILRNHADINLGWRDL